MLVEILILVVFVVVLSLAVYRIAQFSTKETPFEEALAEQRQKKHFDILPSKSDKQKKQKEKAKKAKSKKEESNALHSSGRKEGTPPVPQPALKENMSKESKIDSQKKLEVDRTKTKVSSQNSPKILSSPSIQKDTTPNPSPQGGKIQKTGSKVKENEKIVSNETKNDKQSDTNKKSSEKKEDKKITEKLIDSVAENKKGKKNAKKEDNADNSKQEKKREDAKPIEKANDKKESKKVSEKEDKASGKKEDVKVNSEKEGKAKQAKEGKSNDSDNIAVDKKVNASKKEKKPNETDDKKNKEKVKDYPQQINDSIEKSKKPLGHNQVPHGKVENNAKSVPAVVEISLQKNSSSLGQSVKTSTQPPKNVSQGKVSKQINGINSKEEKEKLAEIVATSRMMQEQMEVIGLQMQTKDKKKKEKDVRKKLVSMSDDALLRLLPIIQKSHLSGGEIQMLIDALLNKQQLTGGPGGEWVEKGKMDPIMQLKRQLEDSETRVKEQVEAHQALSAKISDLRAELNSERGRSTTLKKQLDTSTTALQQKLDSATASHNELLVSKLNELKTNLNKEYHTKMLQQQQALKLEGELQLRQLQDSLSEVEKQMQQSVALRLESDVQCQQMKNNIGDTQHQLTLTNQERDELVQTCQQYQQHLSTLKEQISQQEDGFNGRLYEMQQKLSASEASHSQVMLQLTQIANEKDVMQQQVNSVRELLSQNQVKLKTTVFENSELENRLLQAETNLSEIAKIVTNQKAEMERLKEENDSLASQVVRPAAEGRENGDLHHEQEETMSNNHLRAMHEEQISSLTKEISRLKEESSHLRRKNDEEREVFEKRSRNTKALLLRIFPSLEAADHLEHGEFLSEVEAASAALKAQPPVVEIKTQIVEKLVEKIVQDPVLIKNLEDIKKENLDLHQRVERLAEEKVSLESNLKLSSSEEEDRITVISDLETENKSLAEKIVNYQDILANTESLLKTLQKSVESEESTWHEKIVQKEELIRQLTTDKRNLSLQVSELQSSLDKVKQAEEMESQLNYLKEKLSKEEKAKEHIQEQLLKAQEQLKASNLVQVSTNGPANGVEYYEDEISQADTASLVSSEGLSAHSLAEDTNKKKKKKKAGHPSINE